MSIKRRGEINRHKMQFVGANIKLIFVVTSGKGGVGKTTYVR